MDLQRIAREEQAVADDVRSNRPNDLTDRRWAVELEPGIWVIHDSTGQVTVADVLSGG